MAFTKIDSPVQGDILFLIKPGSNKTYYSVVTDDQAIAAGPWTYMGELKQSNEPQLSPIDEIDAALWELI